MPQTATQPKPPVDDALFKAIFGCTISEAMDQILDHFRRLTYNNLDEAKDLTQDVLEKLLAYRHPVPNNGRGLIFRITMNHFIDWKRKASAGFRDLGRPVGNSELINLAGVQKSVEDIAEGTFLRSRFEQACAALPVDQRRIVDLRMDISTGCMDLMNATEIGQILGMPPSTVRGHLRKAKASMRASLDDLL
ncbi:RNA polymerase sigma factor [Nakamurella silvestris]|nr:RNA polymerase sigma factor [Nakamurella silvestris]